MRKIVCSVFSGSVLLVTAAYTAASSANSVKVDSCQISSAWCVPAAKKKPPPKRNDYVKNQLLLLYDSSKPADFADGILKKYHLQEKSVSELGAINKAMILASTNGQDPLELSLDINKHQKTVAAATNNLFFSTATSRRANSGNGYPFALTGIEVAHRFTKGRGVKIGMIDTPIDINHRSLSNAKVKRIDLVPQGNPRNQQHGTEVAGIMISQNPRIGIVPEASLVAVSAFQSNPKNPGQRVSTGNIVAKAINTIIREKVDVLNLSFAGGQDRLVDNLVRKAVRSGIVVVASAGNGGPRAKAAYPAAINEVIAVTAIDRGERLFRGANRGNYIDLAAPGVDIFTTSPRGTFNVSTGTSLATAHVTGVVALLMSMNRNYRGALLERTLERTAVDLGAKGRDNNFGYGLVNLDRALKALGR